MTVTILGNNYVGHAPGRADLIGARRGMDLGAKCQAIIGPDPRRMFWDVFTYGYR